MENMPEGTPASQLSSSPRKRLLFFAEAATLAHVARPMVLAQGLDRALYEVCFACHPRYQELFPALEKPCIPLDSISSDSFLAALAKGSPLYNEQRLTAYVEEDLAIIDQVKPNLIVGDFRLSLSVSARLAGIPYMTITNAYWSPYSRPRYQIPELPLTRLLGATLANPLFRLIRPLAFALHTQPLNRVRKRYGLPSLGLDLRRTYTDADTVLYADLAELIPTFDRPKNHHYIGPINWSPKIALPDWWQRLPTNKPLLYITLGSSGETRVLAEILHAISGLNVHAMVASCGRGHLQAVPDNVSIADFLPGNEAAARADLVVCNGGSPTSMQAIGNEKPVLGIASNLDQYLNMGYLEAQGAGCLVRTSAATPQRIRQAIQTMLDPNSRYAEKSQHLKTSMDRLNPISTFTDLANRLL